MAHSYISNRVHVVFSTHERRNTIRDEIKSNLWSYMVGIGKNHAIPVFAAGGTSNHVHLLLTLPPTMPLAKAVQTIKANSSRWIGESFKWQDGYGAFSISASQVDAVVHYIESQEEHHTKYSFEDEFRTLLLKYGVHFEEGQIFG